MGESTRRLFFALWPDAAVRTRCDWYASSLLGKRVRRTAADNLHITLAFAGSASLETCRCLENQADSVQVAPFHLQLDHLGYWPRPRILWTGPTHTPEGLWELVSALRDVFALCGVERERRPYTAHMTLARKFTPPMPEAAEAPAIDWPVSDFCLVQSVNSENGVRYRVLRRWPLESDQ